MLYLALELSGNARKLAFTIGLGQKARLRTIPARSTDLLLLEGRPRFGSHCRDRIGRSKAGRPRF